MRVCIYVRTYAIPTVHVREELYLYVCTTMCLYVCMYVHMYVSIYSMHVRDGVC